MELQDLLGFIEQYGYFALFFSLWLGIIGMPLPDEMIVMSGGFLSSLEKMVVWKSFLLTYLGVVSGLSLFVSGLPQGEAITSTSEGPIPFFIGVILFIVSFFYSTERKMNQIEALAEGVMVIAKGNLAYRIEKKGQDEIALLTDNINQMAEEIMTSIEMERKIEQQKMSLLQMFHMT